jgi:hypothetical protein
MGRLLLVGIALAVSLLLPIGVSAQQAPTAPPQAQPTTDGVNTGKLVAIGVGVIAGVAVAEALGVVDTASLLGGVVGGYLAAWWYESSNKSMNTRVSVRQPTAASATWRAERLALVQ